MRDTLYRPLQILRFTVRDTLYRPLQILSLTMRDALYRPLQILRLTVRDTLNRPLQILRLTNGLKSFMTNDELASEQKGMTLWQQGLIIEVWEINRGPTLNSAFRSPDLKSLVFVWLPKIDARVTKNHPQTLHELKESICV